MIESLKMLNGDISYRPVEGKFRSKLADIFIDTIDSNSVELFSERNCDIQVSISGQTINEGIISFLVVSDLGEQSLECDLTLLNDVELNEFEVQLAQQIVLHPPRLTHETPKIMVRKHIDGMIDSHQAAQRLGCSQTILKCKLPCSDYRHHEVDGKKEINEYYWSQDLISRLCQMKMWGPNTEDVKFIAKECCYGDHKWAEEILVSLCHKVPKQIGDEDPLKGIKNRSSKIISKEITNIQALNKRKK